MNMKLVEEVRDLLSEVEYPLEFNPEEWEEYLDADCYVYALGLKRNEGYLIGDFIEKRVTQDTPIEKQIRILKEELEEIGFDIVQCEIEDLVDEGSHKIYIEWNEYNEYHFLRQDSDGTWSHKASGHLPTKLDEEGGLIIDPESSEKTVKGMSFIISRF